MAKHPENLIWIDLEMTGLDPDKDKIIEIATLVTDAQLNILAEGPMLAIHQPKAILAGMNDWCTKTHTESGLVDRVHQSRLNTAQAEQQTIAFLKQYVDQGVSPMCGNTICQDRRFLARYMPTLCDYFHYRHLDVSTIKELARRWYPEVFQTMQKESKHLAMDDIKDSLDELKYYREKVFKNAT